MGKRKEKYWETKVWCRMDTDAPTRSLLWMLCAAAMHFEWNPTWIFHDIFEPDTAVGVSLCWSIEGPLNTFLPCCLVAWWSERDSTQTPVRHHLTLVPTRVLCWNIHVGYFKAPWYLIALAAWKIDVNGGHLLLILLPITKRNNSDKGRGMPLLLPFRDWEAKVCNARSMQSLAGLLSYNNAVFII